jgi:hypothetical protein
MEIQTTNIDALPLHSSGTEEHVQLTASEKEPQKPPDNNLNENEFITGLQKAANNGMTGLPSRDIPHMESSVQQDIQATANYIPASQGDYITKHQTTEEIIKQNMDNDLEKNKIDHLFNEFAIPILIVILYFLYQLPAVRQFLLTSFPFCYNHIGEVNLSGRLVNAFIFGAIAYAITKLVHNITV